MNKRVIVTLERSPEFLALNALFANLVETFKQYKKDGVSLSIFLFLALVAFLFGEAESFGHSL